MSDGRWVDDTLYELPREGEMRVPARVYADRELLEAIRTDHSLDQLRNVATLPGIVEAAYAMPDIHQGYGFPVGGLASLDPRVEPVVAQPDLGARRHERARVREVDQLLEPRDEQPRPVRLVEPNVQVAQSHELRRVQLDQLDERGERLLEHLLLRRRLDHELDLRRVLTPLVQPTRSTRP